MHGLVDKSVLWIPWNHSINEFENFMNTWSQEQGQQQLHVPSAKK